MSVGHDSGEAAVFANYARYYDLLYRDKDYEGEATYVASLIRRLRPDARRVLELGCGTGKHAELLSRQNLDVCGLDRSEIMLDQARARAAKATGERGALEFHRHDVRDFDMGRTFEVVLSLFHVVSYQTATQDLRRMFAAVARHLEPGGAFIFDCWYGPAVLSDPPVVRVLRLEDDAIEVTRIAEPTVHVGANVVDVNYEIIIRDKASDRTQRTREVHPMRYLFHPEIELLLSEQGLRLAGAEEWMTGRQPGTDTWGVCFTATRE